ncbi:MAG TPA: YiiX/YebB-like N1pC/P60 family cysteine hydrolase [Anaeromyxobacteraceae bacterium]|nr:YiiX/YebB-like N1pC/P60 family cysteine hydrolase [Anaeromyxobacteraceae bacterium]
MERIIAAVWLLALALGVSALTRGEPGLRSGDVVLQTSRSEQSGFIQEATGSPWSHVGLVELTAGGPVVIEAVGPVRATPWRAWRERGEGGRVLVLRPRHLPPEALARVVAAARRELGKPYDPRFGWGDEALYCSELVHKAFLRGAGVALGEKERLGDLVAASPRRAALEKAAASRWRGPPPRRLEVVTPASIARDPRLERVAGGA